MKERLRKKIVWDEHGISEILADILILAMTVVLFAIIFAFVYTLPSPNEATYADFDTNIDLYDPTGATINVTHSSGEDLYRGDTDIYLFLNQNQIVRRLFTQDVDYGLTGDSTWSPSETWTYYFSGVTASDDLEIKIVDTRAQTLIYAAKLLGAGVNDAPIIMERWYSPKPAVNASTLTIYANVMDRDGFDDISSPGAVSVNVSALNRSLPSVDLTAISNTENIGLFKGDVVIDKGEGSYTVTIIAEDSSGRIDRRRMEINVAYTGLNAPRIGPRQTIPMVGVNGTDITVVARVDDLDGYDNIDYVTVDIGPLENPNGTPNIVYMSDPEEDGEFEYSTVTYVPRGGDFYRLNFTAMDITGLSDQAHLNVSVKKFNPVISRMWTVPTTGKDDESMTVFAEVSDWDGYSDIKEVLVNLTALNPTLGWDTMLDPEQDGIFEYSLIINVTTGGNKTVLFLARDMTGNQVTANMKVFVSTLNAPVILNRWTDPNFPENNSQLKIFARVIDPDGYDDIGSVWVNISAINRTYNGSAAWVVMIDPNQDGNYFNISWVDQEAGTYMLEFMAMDKGGNIAYATLNLTILPYRPRFLNVWTNPTIGRNGSYIQIFANVMDPNGYNDIANVTVDIVHLNQSLNQSIPIWMEMIDFNRNGTFLNITKINVNESGLYSINFTAMDQSGNIATINHQLIVTSYKPTVIQAWYVPAPVLNGTNVTIYAWVWDDDGIEDITSVMLNVSALSKTLTWVNMTDPDGNGIYENVTFIDGINKTGTYEVTIFAFDSIGNSDNTTLDVEISIIAVGEEQGATIFGLVIPNGVTGGGTVYINALAINGTSPDDKIIKVTFQLINGPKLVWPPESQPGVEIEMTSFYESLFRDPNYNDGRKAPIATQYNDVVYIRFRAYNSTTVSPEYKIAEETLTLLVIWDKSGGKVTEGTALEQNVAWISGDQGYVITNNKSTPDPHQIFDTSKAEDELVWIKIGSNVITNTEKANIFRLHSRTIDEDVEPYSSLQFEYDGVLAGYWFFVLNFSAKELYNGWMADNGLTSEYFDVYMKIKDSTDDFFATNSWIVVHGGTMEFYAEVHAYYHPTYVPGSSSWDPSVPLFPSGLLKADADTPLDNDDDHIFNSTERVYLRIVVVTPDDTYPTVDANQVELVDFIGNRPISNVPGTGPISIPERYNPFGAYDYWLVIDLLRADKDPWVIGESAYTIFIRDFYDSDEQFDFMSTHLLIHSPSSILDVVSGMPSQASTTRDNYVGFYYENIGIFDKDPYEIIPGGASDDVEAVWSVAFADLDNDEKKDVVAACQAGYLYLYQNNGFWTRQVLDTITGEAFTNVYAGDIDDDGDEDIVAGDSVGNVYYYENDGSWGGSPDQTITGGFGSIGDTTKNEAHSDIGDHALALIDIDNDYNLDLVIGAANGLYYSLYNPATKQFGTATQIFAKGVYCVAVGDIDQDGWNDIAFSDNENKHIWVELNDASTPTYFDDPAVQVVNNYGTEASIAVGNLDGSDWLEVVVGRGTLRVYTYNIVSKIWELASDQPSGYTLSDHGEITSIVVDNVDGAIEDDIMVATAGDLPSGDGGFIFYFRNMGQGSEYLLMQPHVENLKQNIGVTQEICTITLGDADEGLA
jgi:hypothetical protein